MYRIKQFFWGMFARLTQADWELLDQYLSDYEKALFHMLPRNEQLHSVKVARMVKERTSGTAGRSIVRAALLHDFGKIQSGLNLFTKSILVLSDQFFPKATRKAQGLKAVHAYYNHPEIAVSLLPDCDEAIKYYILNHHNYGLDGDEGLKLLQEADSKN